MCYDKVTRLGALCATSHTEQQQSGETNAAGNRGRGSIENTRSRHGIKWRDSDVPCDEAARHLARGRAQYAQNA